MEKKCSDKCATFGVSNFVGRCEWTFENWCTNSHFDALRFQLQIDTFRLTHSECVEKLSSAKHLMNQS